MLEAFVVGVRLRLIDGVTAGLGLMSRGFLRAQGDADALQRKLSFVQKGLLIGGGMMAASGSIFWLLDKTLPAAEAYAHQLNIMNMAGVKQVDIAKAIGAAWQTTQDVVTTTATGNLSMLMDMRNVLQGGMPEAIKMLPITAKISAVMAASSESKLSGNAQGIAFDIAKAMDIMGMNTFAQMQHGAEQMSKVVTAFQNRISPTALAQTLYYARQARYTNDDSFLYGVLPTMMLERAGSGGGGGSRGIGPQLAALNRVAVMGTMNKDTIAWFQNLGLLHGPSLNTSTINSQTAGLDNKADWQNNQFIATWAHLVPALLKHGVADTPEALRVAIENSHMAQTAMSQLLEYVTKPGNFLRDMSNVGVMPELKDLPPLLRQMAEKMGLRSGQGAIGYQQAYAMALSNDPGTIMAGVKAQWQNVLTSFGMSVLPNLLNALKNFMPYLAQFSKWLNDNPAKVKQLVDKLIIFGAALGGLGAITIVVTGLQSLIWILGPVVAGIGAVSAEVASLAGLPLIALAGGLTALGAGVYELWKHWSAITGFFSHAKANAAANHSDTPWYLRGFGHGAAKAPGGYQSNMTSVDLHSAFKSALDGMSVQMDGQIVGRIVMGHQDTQSNRPSTGPTGFDTHISALRPDFAY